MARRRFHARRGSRGMLGGGISIKKLAFGAGAGIAVKVLLDAFPQIKSMIPNPDIVVPLVSAGAGYAVGKTQGAIAGGAASFMMSHVSTGTGGSGLILH